MRKIMICMLTAGAILAACSENNMSASVGTEVVLVNAEFETGGEQKLDEADIQMEVEGVIPISPIMPGMSVEQIKEIDPDITIDENTFLASKNYEDLEFYTALLPGVIEETIIWTCSSRDNEGNALRMEEVYDELTAYCSENYELVSTTEKEDNLITTWRTDQNIINIILNLQGAATEFTVIIGTVY